MRILVTGGAGFIGSHLSEALASLGHQVSIIDNLSAGEDNLGYLAEAGLTVTKEDIGDYEATSRAVKGQEVIFHLAAMNRAGRSIKDPVGAHHSNATGTLNVFEASRQHKVKKVIFVSSSSVLGGSEGTLTEETPYNPLHPYGAGKAIGEMYAKIYNEVYGQDISVLRYFSIYGPRQKGNLDYPAVIAKLVMLAFEGEPLTIYGDGAQLRNYTYVDDAVRATIRAMETKEAKNHILHVANDHEASILDIVSVIKNLIGGDITTTFEKLVAPEPRRNNPDINLTKQILSWKPEVSLEEGIKRYIDWYKNDK